MQYWTGCEAWLPAVGERKVIFVRADPNGGEGRRYRMRSPSWWGPEADYLSALKVLFPLRDVRDLPKAKAALERRMKRGAFPEGVTRALSRMLLER